jgi:hypothetical protein
VSRALVTHQVTAQLTLAGRQQLISVPSATVNVVDVGTSTPISDALYASPTGTSTLTNPLTADARGVVTFYMNTPRYVDLLKSAAGYTTTRETVAADVPETDPGGLIFTIESRGAAVDGTTDDTAAWQAALAAAKAAGLATVEMGRGTSMLTQLVVDASNIKLRGLGRGLSKVKSPAAANKIPFVFAAGSTITNVGVEGLEVDGNGASQTVVNGNVGSAAWNTAYAVSSQERTQQGVYGIAFRDCYGVTVRDCYVHDTLNTGIQINQCGAVLVQGNYVEHCGMVRSTQNATYTQPCNSISVINKPTNATYPGDGFRIVNNDVRQVTDIGIDLHGSSANQIVCTGNVVRDQASGTANGASYWGLSLEMESADTVDNQGATISGNTISNLAVAIVCANTANASHTINATAISGNRIDTCTVAFYPFGKYLTFSGNVALNCTRGVSTNNITLGTNEYWTFVGNSFQITGSASDSAAFLFRVSAASVTLRHIVISGNTATGSSSNTARSNGVFIDSFAASTVVDSIKIEGNVFTNFNTGVGVAATAGTSTNIEVLDNTLIGNQSYGIDLAGGTGTVIRGGRVAGSGGATNGISATTALSVRNVVGYNDTLATASLTPSGSPYSPAASHRDSMVNVAGGTVSAITVGGVATGLTAGSFWVPAGKQISITYTVAPTVQQVSY